MKTRINLKYLELHFPRPFDETSVRDILTGLAAISWHGHIVFEARAAEGHMGEVIGRRKREDI